MIYRRPVRDVLDEAQGRICGCHILLAYAAVAAATGIMAICSLLASSDGYFGWDDVVEANGGLVVTYSATYGWARQCSDATAVFPVAGAPPMTVTALGCASLSAGAVFNDDSGFVAVPGSWLVRGAGLAVCLGQCAVAAVGISFAVALVLLYCNIIIAPRGFNHMCVMGTSFIAGSLYLIFSCVVAFYLCVRGSLEQTMGQADALLPGWAYGVTVANTALLVTVGTLAVLDSTIDFAVASPQYTSTTKNEDQVAKTLKRLRRVIELPLPEDPNWDAKTENEEDGGDSVAPIA